MVLWQERPMHKIMWCCGKKRRGFPKRSPLVRIAVHWPVCAITYNTNANYTIVKFSFYILQIIKKYGINFLLAGFLAGAAGVTKTHTGVKQWVIARKKRAPPHPPQQQRSCCMRLVWQDAHTNHPIHTVHPDQWRGHCPLLPASLLMSDPRERACN
jgi:hypothetical protein